MPHNVKGEILTWTRNYVTVTEPMEAQQPWLQLFRPLQHNNQTWLNEWPELEI